jgi:hypothetical protein
VLHGVSDCVEGCASSHPVRGSQLVFLRTCYWSVIMKCTQKAVRLSYLTAGAQVEGWHQRRERCQVAACVCSLGPADDGLTSSDCRIILQLCIRCRALPYRVALGANVRSK